MFKFTLQVSPPNCSTSLRSWSMCLDFLARVLVLFSRIQQPNVFHHCRHVQLVQFDMTVVFMNSNYIKTTSSSNIYLCTRTWDTIHIYAWWFPAKVILDGIQRDEDFLHGTTTLLMWWTVLWTKSRKANVMQYTLGGLTFRLRSSIMTQNYSYHFSINSYTYNAEKYRLHKKKKKALKPQAS